MIYIFDNSPLSTLFRNFYRGRFPSLWREFDRLTGEGQILSTREAYREIEDASDENLRLWAQQNRNLFSTPTAAEGTFVAQIYRVPHFQHNIEQQKILLGGKNADPFVIAKASVTPDSIVVTMEHLRPNAAKIPNICEHFRIRWCNLEQFMEIERWQF